MKTLTIKGMEFPFADKQEKHTRQGITGETFVYEYRLGKAGLPEHKDALYTEKGYKRIKYVAEARAEQTGKPIQDCIHSALWYTLFNQPKTLIIYANKIDTNVIGIMKFCLTHGTTVALEDRYSNTKQVYTPICNLYTEPLFKIFKVENINISEIPESMLKQVTKKLETLESERYKYMMNIWPTVNDTLYELSNFYKLDKIETAEEALIWAERYRTQEILQSYGASITVYDLDKPEVFNAIVQEVSIWGPVFDINLKLESALPTVDTYKPQQWIRQSAQANPLNAAATRMRSIMNIKRALRRDSLQDIVSAYIQIEFYKEHLNDVFPHDTHMFCPTCGMPMNRQHSECKFCSTPNTEVLPELESYDYRAYMIEKAQDVE